MTQIYSDPKRESEPGALPDVEVWCAPIKLVGCGRCGGESEMPVSADTVCHSCGDSERVNRIEGTARIGWWWQACFPGCLPDGDPSGPFDTEAEAIADAREGVEDGDLDAGEDEPGEEDYYLSDDARSIYYCGKVIVGPVPADAEPCPQDAVMELLAEYIDEDGYAPDVWKISDHGNPILISVQECGCYFTEHRGRACDHNRVHIIASDGSTVLSNSRNLAGLRRAARKYSVRMVTLNLMPEGAGELRVWFSPNIINGKFHGAICVVPFASFVVMCGFVARWRSVQEAESYIAGMARGSVEHAKPLLLSIYNHERLTIDSPDGDVEV